MTGSAGTGSEGRGAAAPAGASLPTVGERVGGFLVVEVEPEGKRLCCRVRDEQSGRTGMLRLVPPALERHLGPADFRKLLREAHDATAVRRADIAALLAVGRIGSTWYIISEEVEGTTAAAHAAAGPVDYRIAGEWCAAIADALEAVHAAKLTHRDVRPEHIVIRPDGTVCLSGLGVTGLSERLQELRLGKPVASPHYAAPELCRGEPCDGRADTYSLGATYFHLLTGAPPYSAEMPMQLLQKHGVEPVPNPCLTNPDIPPLHAGVIRKAMAPRPEGRFPSAALLAGTLRRLLGTASSAGSGGVEPRQAVFEAPAASADTAPPPSLPPVELPEPTGVGSSRSALAAVTGGGGGRKWWITGAAVLAAAVVGSWLLGGFRTGDGKGAGDKDSERSDDGPGTVAPGPGEAAHRTPDLDNVAALRKAAHPQWIWFPEGDPRKNAPKEVRWFRGTVEVPPPTGAGSPVALRAVIDIVADNRFDLFVNGNPAGSGDDWERPVRIDITKHVIAGRNLLAVKASNDGGPAGLCLGGIIRLAERDVILRTAGDWKTSRQEQPGWTEAGFDDSAWSAAVELGEFGTVPIWEAAGKQVDDVVSRWTPPWHQAFVAGHDTPKVLTEYGGRTNVLMTHPEDRKKPAALECRVDLAPGKAYMLSFWAAGHNSDKADWLLRAFVDGAKVREQVIPRLADGWQYVVIDLTPFAGRRVRIRLENAAGGREIWNFEFGFWCDLRIIRK